MNRSLLCLALLVAAPSFAAEPASTPPLPLPYTLPVKMEYHRFFVEAQAPDGQVLRLFTDSGGGMNLSTIGADKLGISYSHPAGETQEPVGSTPWPQYAGAPIPPPKSALPGGAVPILTLPPGLHFDGMLGAPWFGNRTWEWDYRAGTLRMMPDGALPKVKAMHVATLGFQHGDDGAHTTHFARIPARIDGQDLQFLFDTGATFRLDATAAAALGDAAVRERAGDFIIASVMQDWHARHPDWQYLDKGDSGMSMIRVPDVEVAGFHTGPAWFSSRPDKAFREYMAKWMDQPVDGALGGEAFRDFRITVDYNAEKAVFAR